VLTDERVAETYSGIDAMLIAPGFGDRGIEGKITAAKYAREKKIQLLGICLGMQVTTTEFARSVLGLSQANSVDIELETLHPVNSLMADQKNVVDKGGTMRLGAWKCALIQGPELHEIYGSRSISERHRHRYEFNSEYRSD